MKKLDDMRRPGAALCLIAGLWAVVKGISMGDWLKAVGGFAVIVIGFLVVYYLLRESRA